MMFQKDIETMPREQIEAIQLERLKETVKYCYDNVPLYNKRLTDCGVGDGSKIRTLSDIQYIPFTTKDDLRNTYPCGLFAVPRSEVVRIHASSGTTGKATVVGYTRRDIEIWSECVSRVLAMADIGKNDTVQVSYGYGLFTGGLGAHYGVENVGATVVPLSTGNTKKQLTMMKDLGVTAIMCTPSYLMYLTESIEEQGILDELQLKSAVCGAEPWTEEMRNQIESRLHIKAHDIYGLSEIMGPGVAGDCVYHKGLHINEDHFLPEIISADTLTPIGDGEIGELVFTTLTKEALPLIRYRTKDLTSITHGKCECGRTTARLSRFVGRSDDMLIIRGVNVFPSQVEAALLEMGEVSPNYLMIVDRVNNLDTLEVLVEVDEKFFSDEIKELSIFQDRKDLLCYDGKSSAVVE